MFGILLFFHLTSLAVWLGSMLISALLLKSFKNSDKANSSEFIKQLTKYISMLTHPSSFLILVTGIWMLILQAGDDANQFWLQYMQGLGTLLVIGFIVMISIYSRKLSKGLTSPQKGSTTVGLSAYINTLLITSLLIISIIFVVAMKF